MSPDGTRQVILGLADIDQISDTLDRFPFPFVGIAISTVCVVDDDWDGDSCW